MFRVVILGRRGDSSIALALMNSLGEEMCVEAFGSFGAVRRGRGQPRTVLIDAERIRCIEDSPTVIVFKKEFRGEIPKICAKCTAVLDESNTALLNSMLNFPFPTICCGMSQRNTVTVSSVGVGETVVSLQRQIVALDGKVIEPSDISVSAPENTGHYTMMAAAAVHLLLGIESPGIKI